MAVFLRTKYILFITCSTHALTLSTSPPQKDEEEEEEEEEKLREFREKKDFSPTFAVFLESQKHLYIKRCLVSGAHCRFWMPETKNRDQTLAALEPSIVDTKSRHNNSN